MTVKIMDVNNISFFLVINPFQSYYYINVILYLYLII